MTKRDKNSKNTNKVNAKENNFPAEKKELEKSVEEKIKETLNTLNTKDKKELEERLGTGDFFEQLRKYFEEKHPSLLDEIESKDKLKIYVEQMNKNGFSLQKIMKDTKSLDESFKEGKNEYDVTKTSLERLKEYCEKEKKELGITRFDEFCEFAKIKKIPISIEKDSQIQKVSDLKSQRNKFLEKNEIKLSDTYKQETDNIMSPKYAPTTRLLVSAAIKKIRKALPADLQVKYKERFTLPLGIHSDIQDLNDFKIQRKLFLQENQNRIDKDLAKKLDGIWVLNQDMYEEFENEGIAYNKGKGFSEQEQQFRTIFNKLATRQLFDDINKQHTIVDMQIENIGEIFRGFPPYVNDIFKNKEYEYSEIAIKKIDVGFESDIAKMDLEIAQLDKQLEKLVNESDKAEIVNKIKKIREEKNKRKRFGYTKRLESKNSKLAKAVGSLVQNNFNLSKIDKEDQQILLNDLVDQKLQSVITAGTAESLGINQERFLELMKDVFDVNKKTITIPSPNGDIVFDCPEKSFLGGPLINSMDIGLKGPEITAESKENLPLNIKLLLSEDNKDFFEKGVIFSDLFTEFKAKNGAVKINDSYKVTVKDSKGNTQTGYLSNYPPKGEKDQEAENNHKKNTQKEASRYLYSKPITRPEDDRELMFWDEENAVIIGENEEQAYEIDIEEKAINLNGKGIGALLFGTTIGQYSEENQISRQQTNKLEESFEKLTNDDLYKDTLENKEEKPEEKTNEEDEKEKDPYIEFKKSIDVWKSFGGYQTTEKSKNQNEGNIDTFGFEKGAKIIVPFLGSVLPPNKEGTSGFLNLEIISDINKNSKEVKLKINGGETKFGKYENHPFTIPLTKEGMESLKKMFGDKVYKLPAGIDKNQNNMISVLEEAKLPDINPSKFFADLERGGKSRNRKLGDKKEEIMYFGKSEFSAGEAMDAEPILETTCKVEYHEGKERPYTVYILDKIGKDKEPEKIKTEMDPINFAIFIANKKLSPKTKEDVEGKKESESQNGPKEAQVGKKIPISISSISSFFKTVSKKVGDGMKKYQEKQEEDLTEAIMFEGGLMSKIAGIMPTDKLKTAFTKVGEEYMLERDSKVWKKIEDQVKTYTSDPDFGGPKMRGAQIQPYLEGKKPFKHHWQAAAILLATIQKGKGPYSRNTDRAGKGMWIKILMGDAHQKRYLTMKEKLEKELQEGIKLNGQGWANDRQNEILKLEMKYITHVVDGRQLRRTDEDVALQEAKFSKAFAGELEKKSNEFFKDTATGAYENTKDISFELARFEYFRLLGDRPQQAIANLKAVGVKAVTPEQFKVFESMVLTGMLSGVFNSITQEDKKFIEKCCRTEGFLPGLLIRQPNAHHKIAKLLTIATGKNITYGDKIYNPSAFDFGKLSSTGQAKDFVNYDKGFNKWYTANAKAIQGFFSLKGENAEGKKLIDIYEDPNTPNDTKQVLKEIIEKRYETMEELDPDMRGNGKALQQNILCRNDSLIGEIIDFSNGSFKGKDKDTIVDTQDARNKIAKEIPQGKLKNNDVIFTLKMFTNRFGKHGFNSTQQKFLIKLLKSIQEEKKAGRNEGIDKMLWYGIVGQIIRNSGSGQVPDELIGGLEAFKNFFENNLDTILTENIIREGFGSSYIEEFAKKPLKVAPWKEYVKVTEHNKGGYSVDLSKEENAENQRKKKKYAIDTVYINSTLYKTAFELERYGIPNGLKEMYDPEAEQKSIVKQLEENLSKDSVWLKNHNKVEKALRKKEVPDDGLTDEERQIQAAQQEEGAYYDGGGYFN